MIAALRAMIMPLLQRWWAWALAFLGITIAAGVTLTASLDAIWTLAQGYLTNSEIGSFAIQSMRVARIDDALAWIVSAYTARATLAAGKAFVKVKPGA